MRSDFHGEFPSMKRGAFTLLELLIAIAILAVLVALCVQGIRSANQAALGVKCISSMRQLGAALNAYRADHNGWYPPGYPAISSVIGGVNFNNVLVPNYIGALPVCPSLHLTDEGKQKFPNEKARLQALGGGYGINAVLLQWKREAMPWPGFSSNVPYSDAKMLFLLETAAQNATWAFTHQQQALNGIAVWYTQGRSHGTSADPAFNFMFLDGHIERISRNDRRDVPENQKNWEYPTNPTAHFQTWPTDDRYISHNIIPDVTFKTLYP
jgi:prepilin-type N-terminal cleavage/methylation domain-containing protein